MLDETLKALQASQCQTYQDIVYLKRFSDANVEELNKMFQAFMLSVNSILDTLQSQQPHLHQLMSIIEDSILLIPLLHLPNLFSF